MTTAPPVPKDFGFGPDEELLRDLARRFLAEHMPVEKLRGLAAPDPAPVYDDGQRPGWDEGVWKKIVELGWTGLAVPEAHGGTAFSLVGIVALLEAAGRHALPSPLGATLAASLVLREAECDAATSFLARIAAGAPATLAITPADGAWDPAKTDVRATRGAGGLRLEGSASFVQDAFKCELFVVSARDGDGIKLCVVSRDAAGLTLEQDHIHDVTRDQATLRLAGVEVADAAVVSADGAGALRRAWPALLCAVSADLCGICEWQLQTTTEYAKTRKQFERQIGFFQAVKHPLVDVMIATDRARSLLYHAASLVDTGHPDALAAARMAKSAASDAGAYASDRSVQLHGGIGFTWESDVHLYFKRSLHGQALYGDGPHQRRHLADVLIGPIGG